MKVFSVSEACNACGECLLSTDLLFDNGEGFAIPTPGRYIENGEQLALAKKLVEQCPVRALSVVEYCSVSSKGTSGLIQLARVLEERMRAVEISDISYRELKFKESDYRVEHGWVDEYKTKYTSWNKAMSAGQEQFRIVYWNHIQDFVASALAQYKSKVLRQFYDLSSPEHTHYAKIGGVMTAILEEIRAEACSLGISPVCFPEDFTKFYPEADLWFQRHLKEQYELYIGSVDFIKSFSEGFKQEDEKNGRDFRFNSRIVAEEYGQMEVKSIFGTAWKPTYRMANVNDAGKRMIEQLLFRLSYPSEYGLRSLDEIYEDNLKFIIGQYRELVDKEITKKVEIFKNVIG